MTQRPTKSALLTPRSVTLGSIVANAALAAGKISAGIFCPSQAILADGLHSTSDLITDVVVLAGLKVSQKPADFGHPYGHRRFTTLAAMFIGSILMAAGAWLAYKAILSLRSPPADVRPGLPFLIAAATIPIKEVFYQITRYVGRRELDLSLLANAWHHRTDAFTSIAAAAGLAGVLLGGPTWQMLDAVTALVLSAFLIIVAARIILFSGSELADQAPSIKTLASIERAMADTRGVRSHHAFRARHVGGKVEMDVHVQVDPALTVGEGHNIASAVKHAIMEADPGVIAVIVHVEPVRENRIGRGI